MEIFPCEIGPGLHLPNPINIIIARGAKIGSDVTIYDGANIGFPRMERPGEWLSSPEIGDRVLIEPGCFVVGRIRVGSDVRLKLGAFVDRDVPNGSVVEASPD